MMKTAGKLVASLSLVLAAACGGAYRSHPAIMVASVQSVSSSQIAGAEPTSGDPQGDTHVNYGVNPWVETARDHLSTFAADVDTASYTYSRRVLQGGALPSKDAVRVEEFVNYFKYAFPQPQPGSPFSVVMDAAPSPLSPEHTIVRVGVATPAKLASERKAATLVFLVDVSGSMDEPTKLPLAKRAMKTLVGQLRESDTVALVTYAGTTRVALPATSVEHRAQILAAIDKLSSAGSTAMASGLDLAYAEAAKGLRAGAISRVIVLTDGDANVGPTSASDLLAMIDSRVKAGVTLSTIGFGMGNYRDSLLEQLGDHGNGNNFYIDSDAAAEKLFTSDLVGVLEVAAKDVKLQVDFDAEQVARYRLVGYENRDIQDADFRKDTIDAGEIGVGHQVTALFEVQLTDAARAHPGSLGVVRIRAKQPDAGTADAATETTFPMTQAPAASFAAAAPDLKFAFAVSAFADLLRGAEDAQSWSLDDIAAVAREAAGASPERLELVALIDKARHLRGASATVAR